MIIPHWGAICHVEHGGILRHGFVHHIGTASRSFIPDDGGICLCQHPSRIIRAHSHWAPSLTNTAITRRGAIASIHPQHVYNHRLLFPFPWLKLVDEVLNYRIFVELVGVGVERVPARPFFVMSDAWFRLRSHGRRRGGH